MFVFGLKTFRVWLGIGLETLLLSGLSSRPRTGLRNGLFGFPGTTAGNCRGVSGRLGFMFVLEVLRLGLVLVLRVPVSAGDGSTELLSLIADEFRLFIVGFVLKSEPETLLLWSFGVLGPPARRKRWYLSPFWLDVLLLSSFWGRGAAAVVEEILLESAFLIGAGLCSRATEPL